MHFYVGSEESKFYRRHHFVEFEEIIPPNTLAALRTAFKATLETRAKPKTLSHCSPQEIFSIGHDLFRECPEVKRAVLNQKLAGLAAQLTGEDTLRIAYDQALVSLSNTSQLPFSQPVTLQLISSLNPIVMGAVILLSSETESEPRSYSFENEVTLLVPKPQKPGNVILFSPELPLDLKTLLSHPHEELLLLAYAPQKAIYQHTPADLHTHTLKKLGYGFGDRVRSDTHPLAFQ